MTIVHGTIKEISTLDPNGTGFQKRILTLHSEDNQSMFIEFRGQILGQLHEFKAEDYVRIVIQFKSSVSKRSGIKFNNLIAKSIIPANQSM